METISFDPSAAFAVLDELGEDGQPSEQESQNYDDDGCNHAAYLRCVGCKSAKPLPHTGIEEDVSMGKRLEDVLWFDLWIYAIRTCINRISPLYY